MAVQRTSTFQLDLFSSNLDRVYRVLEYFRNGFHLDAVQVRYGQSAFVLPKPCGTTHPKLDAIWKGRLGGYEVISFGNYRDVLFARRALWLCESIHEVGFVALIVFIPTSPPQLWDNSTRFSLSHG